MIDHTWEDHCNRTSWKLVDDNTHACTIWKIKDQLLLYPIDIYRTPTAATQVPWEEQPEYTVDGPIEGRRQEKSFQSVRSPDHIDNCFRKYINQKIILQTFLR